MPLIIDARSIPSRWAERSSGDGNLHALDLIESRFRPDQCVRLALVNNMPDPALEDTELQFFELLDIASGDVPVILRLYSLTGVPRTDRGQRHLNSFYYSCNDLWQARLDGVIITGTEPRQPDLSDEPYWPALTQLFDWAAENTSSTVLSCLAAHASVLYADGIRRVRLPDKQFGVFESTRNADHALTGGNIEQFRFPHSRWNEVCVADLESCGYDVLTKSAEAGADLFVKKRKKSLFVHFQGHPEYGAATLLKEYRRDIRRFLARERETYPTMPIGYFGAVAAEFLLAFREQALLNRHEEIMDSFPEAAAVEGLRQSWQPSAICIYRNWLKYILSQKADTSAFAQIASFSHQSQRNPYRVS